MKITRRQLRQIIQEATRKSEPVTVEISIESGNLSKDKIQFNSKIANTFYALRPWSQIAKLKIGEKLVFNVAKFWSAEIAPDGSKTTLWDGPIEEARKSIWSELPTDDVILKVTYSTPQVERSAGRDLNMAPEQLRQFVKENRDQDLENKRELDAWKAAHPGESITDFPYYSEKEWGKDYIKSLEKMEESMKITRRQLRQIILEACGCGSAPEPEIQNYIDETELSTRFADEASAKAAALTSTVTLADALEISGVDINDQLLSRVYVAILDVMRDEQRGTHDDIDDEVEPPSVEDAFYPEEVEAREDAWSGGDNIEDPLDHADFETGESNTGPHVRTGGCGMREAKITRRQLRKIIKEEVSSLVEEDTETDWADTLPTGIVKYDGGKKKRTDVEAIQKALKALAKLKHTSDPGTVDGRYGNNTVNSIKAFQRKASDVKVDGDYGPQTRKAMVDLLKKAPEEKSDQSKKEESETEDATKKAEAQPSTQTDKAAQCPAQWDRSGKTLWGVDMSKANTKPNAWGEDLGAVYNYMTKDMKGALDTLAKRKLCWRGQPEESRIIPSGRWVTYFASKADWRLNEKQGDQKFPFNSAKTAIYTKYQKEKIKRLWVDVAVYPFKVDDISFQLVVQIEKYTTPAKTQPATTKDPAEDKAG